MVKFNYDAARRGAMVITQDGVVVECDINDNDKDYPVAGTMKTDYGTETLHFTRDGESHPNAGRSVQLYMNEIQQTLLLF